MASVQCCKPAGKTCNGSGKGYVEEHSSVHGLAFKPFGQNKPAHTETQSQHGVIKTQSYCTQTQTTNPNNTTGVLHGSGRVKREKRGEPKKRGLFQRIKDKITDDSSSSSSSSSSESDNDDEANKKNSGRSKKGECGC